GKHAAMLATCAVAGWPLDGYQRREHPLQRELMGILGGFIDVDLDDAPWGVDGCGLPTYGVPLTALPAAFARARADPGFRRCQAAMAAHPFLVAGTGRFDTALLEAAGDTLTAKIGGAAIWVASGRNDGPAVAVKLEAGSGEAIPPVALAVLRQLELLPEELPQALQPFEHPVLRNWAGDAVGETRAAVPQLSA
ncbi:MAG: asparaginase, partial [Candidatus Dormibacteraeota bacterium]|nr:asparaginase [Candidatus Dormibacteraeota bacterium]